MGKNKTIPISSTPHLPKLKDWEDFEKYVAELYVLLGARDVKHNINIDGNQIDVYAVVPSVDGSDVRSVISCKHYSKVVGVEAVREWNAVVRALSNTGKVDVGVIVSPKGFSQDAQLAASSTGIKLMPLSRLEWAESDFHPYLRSFTNKLSELPVFKSNAYIPMRVMEESSGDIISTEAMIDNFLSSPTCNLLTLLGDYGSGKTTFVRHLFQILYKQFLVSDQNSRIPIYINLRDYPGHLNIPSLITDLLVNQYCCRYKGHQAMVRLMNSGKVLLIFDAFDEMASRTDYKITLNNFRAIASCLLDSSKILLTCRTHYFKDRSEINKVQNGTDLYREGIKLGNQIAYLQGFEENDIEKYVKAVCIEKADEYILQIKNTYDLMGLSKRPILLNMITDVLPKVIEEGNPINTSTLYSKYTHVWLERDDWRVSLTAAMRLKFTIAFAEEVYSKGATTFTWKEIEHALSRKWPTSSQTEREWYSYDIRTCSFVFWEGKTGHYRFVHESFMEYFVASNIYESLIMQPPGPAFTSRMHTQQVIDFLLSHPETAQMNAHFNDLLPKAPGDSFEENDHNKFDYYSYGIQPIEQCLERDLHFGNAINIFSVRDHRIQSRMIQRATISDLRPRATIWTKCIFKDLLIKNSEYRENTENDCEYHQVRFDQLSVSDHITKDNHYSFCKFVEISYNETCVDQTKYHNCNMTRCSNNTKFTCKNIEFNKNNVINTIINNTEIEMSRAQQLELNHLKAINIKLTDLNVVSGKFQDCNIANIHVDNSKFDTCQFDELDIGLAKLRNVTFYNCKFSNVSFGASNNEAVTFASCFLNKGVLIDHMFLYNSHFIGCEFTEADKTFKSISELFVKNVHNQPPSFSNCKGINHNLTYKLTSLGCHFVTTPLTSAE